MTDRHLTLVVCGAPLAVRTTDTTEALTSAGWTVTMVGSDAARQWHPWHPPAAPHTRPPRADRPRPEQILACPLTFNTANKVVAGIIDTPVCGVLCDALGAGLPITAVPMVNDRLWRHPVWPSTLAALTRAGVRFLDPATGRLGTPAPVTSGNGPSVIANFDPDWLAAALPT